MKQQLLKKIFLFSFICLTGIYQTNAQADIEFTFDGTTFEGWTRQAGTGAFVSAFANSNPGDALNVSWPDVGANTRNVIMYGPNATIGSLDADTYKFMQVIVSNTDSQIGIMRIRGRVAGGGFSNFIDVPITTDAAGTFSTYNFEITNAAFAGTLDRFQIVFRSASNAVLTANANTDTILVHNILVSAANTLSVDQFQAFEFEMFPNPVKNKLNIESKDAITNVAVFDLLGKEVISSNIVKNTLDVSTLSNGVYIIKLTSDKGVATKKFVKE